MCDWCAQVKSVQTCERHFVPLAIQALPVERRFPRLTLHGIPAIRQPVSEVTVATILDKRQVLTIGHETVEEGKILDKHPMRWLLIVETKTRRVIAYLIYATGKGDEMGCRVRW